MPTTLHLLACDHHGSVLCRAARGPVRLAYTPFGFNVSGDPALKFNGQCSEPFGGRYLLGNGYRAYLPMLGRFNSPDSLSPFADGGINCYVYCHSDPVNSIDPSGHVAALRALRSVETSDVARNISRWGAPSEPKLIGANPERALRRARQLEMLDHGGESVATMYARTLEQGAQLRSFHDRLIREANDIIANMYEPIVNNRVSIGPISTNISFADALIFNQKSPLPKLFALAETTNPFTRQAGDLLNIVTRESYGFLNPAGRAAMARQIRDRLRAGNFADDWYSIYRLP